MKKITIECHNISKSFSNGSQTIQVLRNVNLAAHENELMMLMGPSGSGKTTLISIIGGILEQDSGECLILGKPINQLPEQEKTIFRGNTIGFMFQNFTLVPTLTALENAAIPLLCLKQDPTRAYERAKQLLCTIGLEKQLYKKPAQLSGGEQQRVAIARACVHMPKIILCDEPTGFLDHERGMQIMQILKDLTVSNNCTIIVVTHDHRILSFADSIVEIEDGTIKQSK
ncbi:ABC transporter ATP-binding protein [Candidatus Dependentiae bacterium Noda2021]|nr:ABC transporter ATP-binding protein [Candidatus Dependentiae bacterium Noda2021]